MKKQTINKVIRDKVDKFLNSLPQEIALSIRSDIIVTGGCIASMLRQEPVNDYDIYLRTQKSAYLLAEHYANELTERTGHPSEIIAIDEDGAMHFSGRGEDDDPDRLSRNSFINRPNLPGVLNIAIYIKSAGSVAINEAGVATEPDDSDAEPPMPGDNGNTGKDESTDYCSKFRPVFISPNAITLSGKIQIVLRFTGEPDEIHKNYDFVHATNYWTYKTGVVLNLPAMEALMASQLVYKGSRYPLASIMRTRKFIKRGWHCPIANYVKMAMQLNELNLTDINTLREQLTGVDQAYLHSIITAVEKAAESRDGKDTSWVMEYVCSIIDRLIDGAQLDAPEEQ